jgi:8-oxo-dGTP pyrophosphatase MutT (NUDIX family)
VRQGPERNRPALIKNFALLKIVLPFEFSKTTRTTEGIMVARRQVAALPLRRAGNGTVEILLVTSRGTGRWIIPKGWPSKRLRDRKAAAREARQEAGVKGRITPKAIGSYRYVKPELGESCQIDVAVFLLDVLKQRKRWPEMHQRKRAWFGVLDAAEKIREPELSSLIGGLQDN